MSSFAESFWSSDYATGINALFEKLEQGLVENKEFISLVTARMEFERNFGMSLHYIPANQAPLKTGFGRDDGASLKNAFKGVSYQMAEEGDHHIKIADDIKILVDDFIRWSEIHERNIHYSEQVLKGLLKVYKHKSQSLKSIQTEYFKECRKLETLKEGLSEEEILKQLSLDDGEPQSTATETEEEPLILSGDEYSKSDLKELFSQLLETVPQSLLEVNRWITYEHVSTGSAITKALQKVLGISNIDKAEEYGKDLISTGFLKKVSSSFLTGGNIFANSGSFNYQWQQSAYEAAQLINHEPEDTMAKRENDFDDDASLSSKKIIKYFDKVKSSLEEPTLKKTHREVVELERSYKNKSEKLDKIRCELEEKIFEHLSFMEDCEIKRLGALKQGLSQFSLVLSKNLPLLTSTIDEIQRYEETISPDKDLSYLIQTYRTGRFNPTPAVYESYFEYSKDQIFGVDLLTRCNNDSKPIPVVVQAILVYLDKVFETLGDDQAVADTWLSNVNLQKTHDIRHAIEEHGSSALDHELFSSYEPKVVANVLKLYLLELPDSIIPESEYGTIKFIYNDFGSANQLEQRFNGISNTLRGLGKGNLSTLNAICLHFHNLIAIFEEKNSSLANSFHQSISNELSYYILRPKTSNSLQFEEKHPSRLLFDLLGNYKQIFESLKRGKALSKRSNKGKTDAQLPPEPDTKPTTVPEIIIDITSDDENA